MTDEFAARLEKKNARLVDRHKEMVPVITAVFNTVTSLFDIVMRYADFIQNHGIPLDRDRGYLKIHCGAIEMQVPLRRRCSVFIDINCPPPLRLGDMLSPESGYGLDFYECNLIEIEPGAPDFKQFRDHKSLEFARFVNATISKISDFTSIIEDAFIVQLEDLLCVDLMESTGS